MTDRYKPIFLFASSWRSGSTLLQRYITASGEALIWGETGGALNALRDALDGWEQITADSSRRFEGAAGGNGEQAYNRFVYTHKIEHAHQWIANLCPPYSDVSETMRTLLVELYGKRAEALGYPRFGIKETRCELSTAHFLRKLFPDAKFLFLVRNPFAVIMSIKRRQWMGRQANHATLLYYAEHWRSRTEQFRNADFGMTLRYEDFVSDPELRGRLMDYLEINVRPPANFTEISKVDWTTNDTSVLTRWERTRLRHWLSDEMRRWGY